MEITLIEGDKWATKTIEYRIEKTCLEGDVQWNCQSQ